MKILQSVIINCAHTISHMAESFQLLSCIRGYHVYKNLWKPFLKNLLTSLSKRKKYIMIMKGYAMAVLYHAVLVSLLP